VYGRQFFANILRAFPIEARLISIRRHGKPVSTAFLLGHGDMLEIPWASTLRDVNPLNINMMLYREILGFAVKEGYTFFDFGRSTRDSGTFHFKKQWGAQPVQHYWHYWLAHGGGLPALKPDSPKFRLLVSCWKRLPVILSQLLGPHIVKYLP
jgi:predicted N-acyltransferase